MDQFFSFFVVLFVGVFFSALFGRLHLPWVIALIVGGAIAGPNGFGWFVPDDSLRFLGEIGLIFLMFMAGLETQLGSFQKERKSIALVSILNAGIPFAAGVAVAIWFGYSLSAALLLGVVFVSSSIAIIIPSLEAHNILKQNVGKLIVGTTIVQDVLSLILLSLLLDSSTSISSLPIGVSYFLIFCVLVALRWLLPLVQDYFAAQHGLFQQELRSVFLVLVGTVVAFEIIGLHPIVAGFFAGLVLSDSLKSQVLQGKIRAISYGLFIPVFFIIIGSEVDASIFIEHKEIWLLTSVLIFVSIAAKFLSGFVAGKILGYTTGESALIGSSTIAQLSTTLAATFSGYELGIIDDKLVNALVSLSVVTTIIGPALIKLSYTTFKHKEEVVKRELAVIPTIQKSDIHESIAKDVL
jgi:Kef-type K+ transport system membrane component KefB